MGRKTSDRQIHICTRCGTTAISGLSACPSCGADEHSGWQKSAGVGARGKEPQGRSGKINHADFFKRNLDWKSVAALLTLAAFVTWILPGGVYFGVILCFAAVICAVYGLRRRRGSRRRQLYRQLLQKAGGDEDLVKRMIENELRRNPDADLDQLMTDAIYRW